MLGLEKCCIMLEIKHALLSKYLPNISLIIVLIFILYDSAVSAMPRFLLRNPYKSGLSLPTECENILYIGYKINSTNTLFLFPRGGFLVNFLF